MKNSLDVSSKDRWQLTALSFLSYMLTGGLVVLTGMVIVPVSKYFNVDVSEAGDIFTWMNLGILIAIISNSALMDIIPLKRQILISVILALIAFMGLTWMHSLIFFCVLMFLFGLVSGITMSIATYLIAHLYMGKNRGMMLLLTDSFFSLAGITFPLIAGFILDHGVTWYWVYIMVLVVGIGVFILSLGVKFPSPADYHETHNKPLFQRLRTDIKHWGVAVYAACLGCMFCILGQLCLVFWIPDYVASRFHVSSDASSVPLSSFWIGMWIGLYLCSILVKRIPMTIFLALIALGSTIACFILRHATSVHQLSIDCFIMGLFAAGIYYTLITLVSLQVKVPSPLLVNFALASGTVGTFLTPMVSAKAVSIGGPMAALTVGNIFYLLVFVVTIIVALTSNHNVHGKHQVKQSRATVH